MNQKFPLKISSFASAVAVIIMTASCSSVKKTSTAPAVASSETNAAKAAWQRDYGASHEKRMEWWRDARFGMFIHWGVYSVPAGTYHGEQSKHIGEWLMRDFNIPCAEYQSYAKEFNPVKFNADEWVSLAKNAGMKYIVITSKHHDGFAMFHSQV